MLKFDFRQQKKVVLFYRVFIVGLHICGVYGFGFRRFSEKEQKESGAKDKKFASDL